MAQTEQIARMAGLRREMRRIGLPWLLITHLPNVRYLTGFSGSNGVVLLSEDSATLFTDSRYTIQAREQVKSAQVTVAGGALLSAVAEFLLKKRVRRVGVEADSLTMAQAGSFRKVAGPKFKLEPTSGLVEGLRARKSAAEAAIVQKAASLICRVFEAILPRIQPGIRENQLAAEIEYQMRLQGAEGPSFETIVASGPRSALPHARPTPRRLRKGELVILDMGAILDGYCSDLTRTVFLGKAPRKIQGWYRGVWEAHQSARSKVRAGVECGVVDAAARLALARAGLDGFFTHSTGHGIGLEIHEGPRLAKGQKTRLQVGNIVTIEPGVYVEGVGGVRIEDDVLVTQSGHKVLTRMCGELLQL